MDNVRGIFVKFKERFGKKEPNGSVTVTAPNKLVEMMNFINFIAYPNGIELTKDWQMNYRTKFTMIVITFMFSWQWYSFYLQFPSILGLVSLGGFTFQVACATRLGAIWFNQEKYYSVIEFLNKVYNENTTGPKGRILLNMTKKMFQHFKLVFTGVIAGFSLYSFYPLYDFLFNGNLTKVSPLVLPSVDETTLRGYFISFVVNVVPIGWQTFGIIAGGCTFLTYVDGYAGLVAVVEVDFKAFDGLWKHEQPDIRQRELAFRNLIMKLMDLVRYNQQMNRLFNLVATVQIGSCYLTTTIVLFAYLAINYLSGLGAAAYFMTELMMFCYMGQLMENTTKRLQMVIYNAQWYTYETKYQRNIMFALSIIQGVKPVLVAGVWPLNFKTGLMVVKGIYTMAMFFANALD